MKHLIGVKGYCVSAFSETARGQYDFWNFEPVRSLPVYNSHDKALETGLRRGWDHCCGSLEVKARRYKDRDATKFLTSLQDWPLPRTIDHTSPES
jgi:hypothetical protein